ncbi:hypothetical protein AB0J83_27970 [Actinoplanes sp. NPDC049596]|uniref:hypothetical protein n=1 Tax=unclassified Actinoplanes TaxID=2626549 RepID=UPI003440ECE4
MTVIDLDREVQPAPHRPARRPARALVALTAGALLLGLPGEPQSPPSPPEGAPFCTVVPGSGAASQNVVVIDSTTGEVVRILHC